MSILFIFLYSLVAGNWLQQLYRGHFNWQLNTWVIIMALLWPVLYTTLTLDGILNKISHAQR